MRKNSNNIVDKVTNAGRTAACVGALAASVFATEGCKTTSPFQEGSLPYIVSKADVGDDVSVYNARIDYAVDGTNGLFDKHITMLVEGSDGNWIAVR